MITTRTRINAAYAEAMIHTLTMDNAWSYHTSISSRPLFTINPSLSRAVNFSLDKGKVVSRPQLHLQGILVQLHDLSRLQISLQLCPESAPPEPRQSPKAFDVWPLWKHWLGQEA